ncbi:thiamine ABC transporter substrate-binding protein [Nocardioides fonticola]|uniref:Thiamine ABC transporter substrate-binding protein n=1 Tax=Nocardioides fonticola TaxID=450363 RepID=A0ABP7XC89_9ACTN
MILRTRARSTALGAAVLTLALGACSLSGGSADEGAADDASPSAGATAGGRVVLLTHDSFSLPKKLIAAFEKESGIDLTIRSTGDAGVLTSQLVLAAGDPVADVAYGIDNTFASRALDADVFAPGTPSADGVAAYDLPGDDEHALAPIDTASVCVNVDDAWFAARTITPPTSLDDLTDPRYRDLFVTPGATTSSPGLAFLLTTIAAYGEDGWQDYWRALLDNGTKVVSGWSDAYEVDFTAGGGGGDRPIVLSYDSSPAFTTDGKGGSTTHALLDTCFRQTEYAGVLQGAANPAGAAAVVAWLQSPQVQAALPDSMYVFPVLPDTALPTDWARFAVQPEKPYSVDPADITAQRDTWLREWNDLIGG